MSINNKNPSDLEIKNLIKEFQSGRFSIAIKLASSITEKFPKHQFTWKMLGILLGITGRIHEAIQANQKAISLLPNDNEAHNNLGNAFRALGKLDEALKSYNQATTIKPDYAEAHNNLAITYQEQGESNLAIKSFKQAIKIKPNYAEAYNNLAFALKELGKLDEAEKNYEKAIALHPNYAEAYNNLGLTLKELGKLEYSEKKYKRAIEIKPKYVEAYNNLALTQKELGKFDEAEKNYKKAIELRPDYAEAKFNLSMLFNLKGNLKLGLQFFEWRLHKKKPSTRSPRKELIWDGIESIQNKKFLVYEELGIGDIFQFYRFLPLLQQKGADVIFKVKPNLHHLFKSSNDRIQLVDALIEKNEIDFEAPIMSLPYLLGTDIGTIPKFIPYLNADKNKIEEWGKKLNSDKFKIGVCWQGSKNKIDVGRSFSLSYFKNISKINGLELISLYKGDDEYKTLNLDFDLKTFGDTFDGDKNAFIDTAAVIMNCDLVITSDTVIAHLAGALGRTVWVVLRYIPHWVWMLNRSDSPWYPTMTLYRQIYLNNWDSVFSRIKKDLISIIDQKN